MKTLNMTKDSRVLGVRQPPSGRLDMTLNKYLPREDWLEHVYKKFGKAFHDELVKTMPPQDEDLDEEYENRLVGLDRVIIKLKPPLSYAAVEDHIVFNYGENSPVIEEFRKELSDDNDKNVLFTPQAAMDLLRTLVRRLHMKMECSEEWRYLHLYNTNSGFKPQ